MADNDTDLIDRMKGWIETFPSDVSAVNAVVGAEKIPRDARLLASVALSYVVTRLDLIPDWEESAGMLDDAMVLRVAMAVAVEQGGVNSLPIEAQKVVHRMANESDVTKEFLGEDLYSKLRKYVEERVNIVVRGRHPRAALEDDKEREQLLVEVRDELKRHGSKAVKDLAATARTIKNYLTTKLMPKQ